MGETRSYPNSYAFERVEIFLRVKGRLPVEGGWLTQEILNDFRSKFSKGELKTGMVNLEYLDKLIADKVIIPMERKVEKEGK